jgi:hypothetical protein
MLYDFFDISSVFVSTRAAVAQSVYRLATGWTIESSEFESLYCQEYSLPHTVQTGYGVHQSCYPKVPAAHSPGIKQTGHEADHSPATSAAEVLNALRHLQTLK